LIVSTALSRKSWTDLSRRPTRAILTALTLALAVASFGILALPSLMNRAMASEVANARLYDLAVPIDQVELSPVQLAELASLPNVSAVTARRLFATRALIGTRRVDAEVWSVPNFTAQPLDRVVTSTVPGNGQVLVDVQDAARGIWHSRPGDTIRLEGAGGSVQALTVAGSARSLALNQDTQSDHLVLYATPGTLQGLTGTAGVNFLEFKLIDRSSAGAAATIASVRSFLVAQPNRSAFSDLPSSRAPGDWPGKQIFTQLSKVLVILTLLAVVSAAFLLANTIRTMVAEQTGEIGIMRAVGAGRRDVRRNYLRMATLLGVVGAAIGVLLGTGLAFLLVSLFARLMFGVSPSFAVDWPIALVSGVVGVAGVLLMTLWTLRRALRVPLRDALESEGLVSAFGKGRIDRAIARAGALPMAVRVGVRNVARQKERSATTIVQIALAVATLLGLLSLSLAVLRVTDQSWNVLDYDITLAAQSGGHSYTNAVVDAVRRQPGVSGAEAVDTSSMTYRGHGLYAWGVHADSFVHEPVAAGRWLTPQDEAGGLPVAVVGSAVARQFHLHPGEFVSLDTAGGPAPFEIIGIGGSDANNGLNVYTTLGTLQTVTAHPGVANTLLVRTADQDHSAIDNLSARLEDTLTRAGYPSHSQVMYQGRANNKAQNHTMVTIVECIGLLIVAISMLGLVNAITMSILERTRELGVLRGLGARSRDLRVMLRTETVTLALIGYLLAIPLGWLVAHALRWLVLNLANLQLPAPYTFGDLGLALVGTIVLAVLVVSLPVRRATRLRPGDAIRYL
jgi:putative ABC transport system permease protein